MKSPFTGGETELVREPRELEFRKETFEIIHHSRRCKDTDEFFTTEALDRLNIVQVHNQYRDKHNIPFPDQICEVRERYGLSATKMSEVLGFGVNTYRNYENGEVPQASNGKLIKLAANPEEFQRLVEISDTLSDRDRQKMLNRIHFLIDQDKNSDERLLMQLLSYKSQMPNLLTGYREMKLQKFGNMVVYFAESIQPFKTKLNKLLFYADFLNYKKTGFSISGCNYRAIELGPVPNGYDTLFEYFQRNDFFTIEHVIFTNREHIGEKFLPSPNKPFEPEFFDESELMSLGFVADFFKEATTDEIVDFSHNELAWKSKERKKELLEYNDAFELSIGSL
ncbi:MAG: type II toxin-antitoxin system antitoxin SocA domain-containing protein [Balneolaceae bacterium]